MRNDIEIRDESTLEDDGYVGGIEELDGVGGVLTTITSTLDWQVNTEPLNTENTNTIIRGEGSFTFSSHHTWKYMTTPNTKMVDIRFIKLGRFCR